MTIFGFIAAGVGLGGMLLIQVITRFGSSGHFALLFVMMSVLHRLAFGVAWLGVRVAERPFRPDQERGHALPQIGFVT